VRIAALAFFNWHRVYRQTPDAEAHGRRHRAWKRRPKTRSPVGIEGESLQSTGRWALQQFLITKTRDLAGSYSRADVAIVTEWLKEFLDALGNRP